MQRTSEIWIDRRETAALRGMERPASTQDKRHRCQHDEAGHLGRGHVPEKESAGHDPGLCRL